MAEAGPNGQTIEAIDAVVTLDAAVAVNAVAVPRALGPSSPLRRRG
ncbi:MAG TPA: hypothetical protein VKW77_08715 [Acidimicrobiales bacterium]|nr:hypothetical protein [Acidimicrobiales bacterium]